MKIALFGGSFDPVHTEHLRLASEAQRQLGLDKLFFIPSYRAPHKALGPVASGEERLRLLQAACAQLPFAEADDLELTAGGTSYTYLTCRAFREKYPDAELFFLVGADMLEDFFSWRSPEEILRCVTLVACGRGENYAHNMHDRFRTRFGKDFLELDFCGREISSSDIRVALAFRDNALARSYLPDEVLSLIESEGMYRIPSIEGGLALLTERRREHSERVARMAVKRARSLGIPEWKALTASMLHDCGKNVQKTDKILQNFLFPADVPPPVLHQFTGAYLAETLFHVTDPDVLNAIRYHTSGRPGMSQLEKLIFLSDLLEEGRSFDGIDTLRAAYYEDLDRCLYLSLKHLLEYLHTQSEPVYSLTERAFEWIKSCIRFE